jgi:hypothetical protein
MRQSAFLNWSGRSKPEDETTDYWSIARERVRTALLETLESWYPNVAWGLCAKEPDGSMTFAGESQ